MKKPHGRQDLPVAIVGGGFSGTLLAINLLRYGTSVVLVERNAAQLGKGLAFGTRRPEHLLNVRASNMSAFPDDLGHFLRWMGFATSDQANRFVPRLAYGQYLHELLMQALSANFDRARIEQSEALAARFDADDVTLTLANGRTLKCSALVLACGNAPPADPFGLADAPPGRYFANPWAPGVTEGLAAGDHIVLVGSGLTAIDVILSLDGAGYRGRVTSVSRHGLKPHSHAESGPIVKPRPEIEAAGSRLVRALRRRAAEVGWRAAIDELRPHTQHVWRRHDHAAQRRFLRHLRPYWDIHRHRMAPAAAARIAAMTEEGRLAFTAGKIVDIALGRPAAQLRLRSRGAEQDVDLTADRIVNCTGPDGDITRSGDPLLGDLLAQGLIRPDVHRLGLDVDHSCRARDAAGQSHERLFAVGPITKGEAWEIVAVPDIRRQVWDLARLMADSHWVGGEGL